MALRVCEETQVVHGKDVTLPSTVERHEERRRMDDVHSAKCGGGWKRHLLEEQPGRAGPEARGPDAEIRWQAAVEQLPVLVVDEDRVTAHLVHLAEVCHQVNDVVVDAGWVRQQRREIDRDMHRTIIANPVGGRSAL